MTRDEPDPPSPVPREHWPDNLRCLATLAVVLLDTCAFRVDRDPDPRSAEWQFVNVLDSACRWSVPAFVMLSGCLLIPKADAGSPGAFYRKRLSRLLLPILFWTCFYVGWSAFRAAHFDLKQTVVSLLTGSVYVHLWYLYMIAGVYLTAPFIAALVRSLDPVTNWRVWIGSFLLLWPHAVLCVVWNIPGTVFAAWVPFVPYFVLGHLLSRLEHSWNWRALAVGFLLAVGGIAGATSILIHLGKPYAFNLCYGYFNPLVTASAVAMFLIARSRLTSPNPLARRISDVSLGIYLVHPFILDLLKVGGIAATGRPTVVWLPVTFLITVVLSYAVSEGYRQARLAVSKRRADNPA
jgi:surface polysaccharide O-acyltransferase-like enzyme